MKKSLLKSSIIILRSFFAFSKTTLYSLFLNSTKQMTREKANTIIKSWSSSILNIAQIRRAHINHGPPLQYIKGRAYIVVCNHTSLYDIPISFEALPDNMRMLTKKELFKIPLFGQLLKYNEFIFIDRHNKNQALADLNHAKKKMEDGIVLWSAPEGTRSKTGRLLKFKKGIFHLAKQTEAIILPIGIRGANLVLPAKSMYFQPNQMIEVHIGRPIDTKKLAPATITELMNITRKQILELTGQDSPKTQHSSN